MKTKRKRRLVVFGCCICFISLICIVGSIWNKITTENDMNKYPPMGQMVEVFDSKLHVFSTGAEVSTEAEEKTIVLLSGWGTTSPTIDFYPLWSRLDSYARVVVLERPGYGWSEEISNERTVQNIMEEDRAALMQAGYSPPYYLVAHSMGGLEATLYASTYPDEVSGIVLIDSKAPDITLESPGQIAALDRLVPSFKSVGLLRFIDMMSPAVIDSTYAKQNNYDLVDESLLQTERALTLRNAQSKMMRQEWKMMLENAMFVKEKGIPENLPLISIISDESRDDPRYSEMLNIQQSWISGSSMSKLIIMHGGHYLHHYNPDEICEIIKELTEN